MAFTYDSLKSFVLYNMGAREGNPRIAARVPEFIEMWEAHMNRELKTGDNEASTLLTTKLNDPRVALPTGFTKERLVRIQSDTIFAENQNAYRRIEPIALGDAYRYARTGDPVGYSIQGNNLVLAPAPDEVLKVALDYYAKFTPLSDSNPTNWILTDHPDAYTAGTVAYGYLAQGSQPRFQQWLNLATSVIADINEFDRTRRQGKLRVRTEVAEMLGSRSYDVYDDGQFLDLERIYE